jgi:hypothetical protein
MSWKNKISGAFGTDDHEFAKHTCDRERAEELLKAAIKENVAFDDYLATIEAWLNSEKCTQSHVEQEMAKVRALSSSYFKYD